MTTREQDLRERVRRLERALADSQRGRSSQPNLRDLNDASLSTVHDGQVPVYDAARGRWVPGAGASPLAWGLSGPVVVTSLHAQAAPVGTIGYLVGSLLQASAATDTVVDLYLNGVSAGTVTIPGGDTQAVATVSIDTALFDELVPHITSAATDAADLTVQAVYA